MNAMTKELRTRRVKHSDLSPAGKKRANARSYANVALKRGHIQRKPCEGCGSADAQMHHDDYDKPLEVRWFCRACHLELHARENREALAWARGT
jgi:hypothetical protein